VQARHPPQLPPRRMSETLTLTLPQATKQPQGVRLRGEHHHARPAHRRPWHPVPLPTSRPRIFTSPHYRSLIRQLAGVRGIYVGHSMTLMRSTIGNAALFGPYELAKDGARRICCDAPHEDPPKARLAPSRPPPRRPHPRRCWACVASLPVGAPGWCATPSTRRKPGCRCAPRPRRRGCGKPWPNSSGKRPRADKLGSLPTSPSFDDFRRSTGASGLFSRGRCRCTRHTCRCMT
jgi:hypothetical protein